MPRYSFAQTEQTSCGAASLATAVAELNHAGGGGIGAAEIPLFEKIKYPDRSGSDPTKLAFHAAKIMMKKVTILEDTARTGGLVGKLDKTAKAQYAALVSYEPAPTTGIKKEDRALAASDLQGGARALLVCIIAGTALMHYVLARHDGGSLWIMNPDGGTDSQVGLHSLAQVPVTIGGVGYIYTGIAIVISN
ncbi:MAG: hypothetical protein ACPGOV_09660 [Magnetovibrionaceae bacterium]